MKTDTTKLSVCLVEIDEHQELLAGIRCWSQDLKLRRGAICQGEPEGIRHTPPNVIDRKITILKGVIYHHFSFNRACLLGSFLPIIGSSQRFGHLLRYKKVALKSASPPIPEVLPTTPHHTAKPRQLMFGCNGTPREPTTDREWRKKEKCLLQQGAPPKNDSLN